MVHRILYEETTFMCSVISTTAVSQWHGPVIHIVSQEKENFFRIYVCTPSWSLLKP